MLSAAVLALTILGGVTAVVFLADDARPPAGTSVMEPEPKARAIPRPNEGQAPSEPGDRGGWAQLALLGLSVVAVSGIGLVVVRGSTASRQRRAAWLAAADSERDGALESPD